MGRDKAATLFDYMKLWALYGVCIIVVYLLPSFVKFPFFLALLFAGYVSKDDSFILAFFIILFAEIGGLFPETSRIEGAYQRLPVYGLGPVRLPLYDIALVMLTIKSYFRSKEALTFKPKLTPVLILLVILAGFSLVLGMDRNSYVFSIRAFLSFLVFFIFPKLLNSEKDILRFMSFLFSAVFLIVYASLAEALSGFRLGNIAGEVYKSALEFREIRVINSPFLVLICFIYASYWLYANRAVGFKRLYLGAIVAICYFLNALSATRGWFLAFSLMLTVSFLVYLNKTHRIIAYLFPMVTVIIFMASSSSQLSYVVGNAIGRLQTIETLVEGDLSAGGTLSRITVRMPRMLVKLKENPIIGFGFSDEYYQYADNHVGWIMQMLQMGILGLFIFLVMFYRFIEYNISIVHLTKEKAVHVFSIALMGIMVIHTSSTAIFAFSALGAQQEIMQMLAILLTGRAILSSHELRLLQQRKYPGDS